MNGQFFGNQTQEDMIELQRLSIMNNGVAGLLQQNYQDKGHRGINIKNNTGAGYIQRKWLLRTSGESKAGSFLSNYSTGGSEVPWSLEIEVGLEATRGSWEQGTKVRLG